MAETAPYRCSSLIELRATEKHMADALWHTLLLEEDYTAFGPERPECRPRGAEECFEATVPDLGGSGLIGLVGIERFGEEDRFWIVVHPDERRQGWLRIIANEVLRYCFAERRAKAVTTEIYTSSPFALQDASSSRVLQVRSIEHHAVTMGGKTYDRYYFGCTRDEWLNWFQVK